MIIGIDLGTTFSVIAVSGQIQMTPGYPEPCYLDQCDVSIIPDQFGNYIIPSALWEDPNELGTLIIGALAKTAADEGYSPILFSKRSIGTDILLPLGNRSFTARQAAAEILRYLKHVAEEALGETVDRAVITHPAYFDPAMKEETALAAQDAGFQFDPEKHLLMEPVAAALTYTRTDTRDPLRTLTYDLGGGTFDVTVMERRRGITTVKAFGGNRLLGGFNFDRELARWILNRLRERGVQLSLNEQNSTDRAKWIRLLRIAEDIKIKLANARGDKMPVQIREQAIFTDDLGRPINLLDQITREQFTTLIQELLDSTITGKGGQGETKGCEATIAEAQLTIDKIDEILLVGGSSYGPWIAQTIQRHWGRDARLFEPDLCVAAGAAIHAMTLPQSVHTAQYHLELDVPAQSILDTVSVAGRIVVTGSEAQFDNLTASLIRPSGEAQHIAVSSAGTFLFDEVELDLDTLNQFQLIVTDVSHQPIITHQFEVVQTDKYTDNSIPTPLPKPLYIEVLGGVKPLAEEGASLPAHVEVELRRVNDDDTIEIRLFQETDPIGSILIEGVPKEAPIGSKVRLAIDVSRNNRISGKASVFTLKGAVAAETLVDVRIPRLQVPDVETLSAEFQQLEEEREELLDIERSAENRMRLQATGERLAKKIGKLFNDPAPDRQELWLALRALRLLVHPPQDEMSPTLVQFEQNILRFKELLSAHPTDLWMQGYQRMVDQLEREGRIAHWHKDQRRWSQVNARCDDLYYHLERALRGEETSIRVRPTSLQKMYALALLDQTRQQLRAKEEELLRQNKLDRVQRQVDRLREQIDSIEVAVEKIDDSTDPETAEDQLLLLRMQGMTIVTERITKLGVDVR